MSRIAEQMDERREDDLARYQDGQEWAEMAERIAMEDAAAIMSSPDRLGLFLDNEGDYLGLADGNPIRIGGPRYCVYDAAVICATLTPESREVIASDIRATLQRAIAEHLLGSTR